ncbi:SDR family oxidoreductase [Microbacterium sp. CPCC 204701]|uniref:SDR family oxidoreductase n=1 Tax=Microbacterium sp. CPCC 204701 TaxID=2493084 RepID=UPI000FD7419E|nr:SDR family NAD(P)-dependent oxidoreductase [Microbacterium sp. CPCC 204701]
MTASEAAGASRGRFAGRVALVTGAVGGIGFAAAARLAAEGAVVAVADIRGDAAGDAASRLPDAFGITVDVADEASAQAAVDAVAERCGRLDVLVNNAGVIRDNLLHRMTLDEWDLVLDVHLRGAFLMSRAAQRVMVPAAYGRIVSLSSIAATGNRGQSNYSAAKAGIVGFTKTLALELGRYGITANAVAPGFVATEMTDRTAERIGVTPEEFRRRTAEATPVRRVGTPDDIATAIGFLAAEEAGFITGQVLTVDGGLDL